MKTIKIPNKKDIKIIAHRGGSLEVENTLGAFIASGVGSFYGIETDVYKTTDGKYIISHDETTRRLMNGDYVVDETDYDTLRSLRFKPQEGRYDRYDLIMPDLQEYLDICKHYEKVAVIEIKKSISRETAKEVYKIVEDTGIIDNTIFISFNFNNLIYLREINPNIPAQFLVDATESTLLQKLTEQSFDLEMVNNVFKDTYQHAMLDVLKNHKIDLDVWDKSTDLQLVEDCHERGILVNVFTPNTIEEANEFINMGVDFITSNVLE